MTPAQRNKLIGELAEAKEQSADALNDIAAAVVEFDYAEEEVRRIEKLLPEMR